MDEELLARISELERQIKELNGKVGAHGRNHEISGNDTVRLSVRDDGADTTGRQRTINFVAPITVSEDTTNQEYDIGLSTAAIAPSSADYLVGTANGSLSAEIVVGTAPGGELGGTWASPTVDATHSGSAHPSAGEQTWLTNGLAGQVAFPATQNPSADANTLDDYEEGTWTPVIGGAGGTSGQTYAARAARYVKAGQNVLAYGYIGLSNKGTITGNVEIQGLPFTVLNVSNAFAVGPLYWKGLATNWVSVIAYPNPNTTIATVVGATAAATGNNTNLATADIQNSTELIVCFSYRADA